MESVYFKGTEFLVDARPSATSVYMVDGELIAEATPEGVYAFFNADDGELAEFGGQNCALRSMDAPTVAEWLLDNYPEGL